MEKVKEDKSAKFNRLFSNRSKKLINQLKLLRQLGANTYRVDTTVVGEFVKNLEEIEIPNLKTALKLTPKPGKMKAETSEAAASETPASDSTASTSS